DRLERSRQRHDLRMGLQFEDAARSKEANIKLGQGIDLTKEQPRVRRLTPGEGQGNRREVTDSPGQEYRLGRVPADVPTQWKRLPSVVPVKPEAKPEIVRQQVHG